MIELYAKKRWLWRRKWDPVAAGSANVRDVKFTFSEDWTGLDKTAVFRAGEASASVLLDETGECAIPWEVLQKPGVRLEAGVYGTRDGTVVLPSIWADLGYISTGAAPGEDALPPAPEIWRQELDRKGDGLGYTQDGKLGLWSGEKLLSAVAISGGEGSGGPGEKGDPGDSAYQIAVKNGFKGTEADWLASLRGAPGSPGTPGENGAPGTDGADGEDGFSPTVNVTAVEGGHRVTITDAGGAQSFDVMDGEDGSGGGADFTTDDTLTMSQGQELSVTTPVRSIVTQAEFDALPEGERNKGLYVISGGGSGGGGGGSGGGSEEVYSTEETRIGTWIDGKPLYRLVVQTVTPGVGVGGIYYSDLTKQMENISRMEGTISLASFFVPFNIYNGAYTAALFYSKSAKSIQANISAAEYANRPCFLILEYTKTTDEGGAV